MQGRTNYDGESDDFIEYVHQSTTSKLLKQTSHPYKLWFSDCDNIFEIISLWSDERVSSIWFWTSTAVAEYLQRFWERIHFIDIIEWTQNDKFIEISLLNWSHFEKDYKKLSLYTVNCNFKTKCLYPRNCMHKRIDCDITILYDVQVYWVT